MPLSPIYNLERTVLSNDNRIASRVSTVIDVTEADIGKWVFAILPQNVLTDPTKEGYLAKERQKNGTWVEINGAKFVGGPDHWDEENLSRIYTAVGIDADDVGIPVRFTWVQMQAYTSRLDLGTMVDRE